MTFRTSHVFTILCQGFSLIASDGPTCPNNRIYGLVTIGINWLPGVAAAVHFTSLYRTRQDCKKTLLWACEAELTSFT